MTKQEQDKKNLISLKDKTPEERRQIASKGGKASVIARKEKSTMKAIAEGLLNLPKKKGKKTNIEDLKSLEDTSKSNFDLKTLIVLKQIEKASEGDLKSAEWIQNLIGEGLFEGIPISSTSQDQEEYLQALEEAIQQKRRKENEIIIDYKIEKKGTEDK